MLTFACPLQHWVYLYLHLYLYKFLFVLVYVTVLISVFVSVFGELFWSAPIRAPPLQLQVGRHCLATIPQSAHFWPRKRPIDPFLAAQAEKGIRPTHILSQTGFNWAVMRCKIGLDPPRDETEIATSCLGLVWRNWQPSIFPERCFSSAAQSMLVAIKENILNGPDWQ